MGAEYNLLSFSFMLGLQVLLALLQPPKLQGAESTESPLSGWTHSVAMRQNALNISFNANESPLEKTGLID